MSDTNSDPFTPTTRKSRTALIAWSAVGLLLGIFGVSKPEITALVSVDFGNTGYIVGTYAIVTAYLLVSFFLYQSDDIAIFQSENIKRLKTQKETLAVYRKSIQGIETRTKMLTDLNIRNIQRKCGLQDSERVDLNQKIQLNSDQRKYMDSTESERKNILEEIDASINESINSMEIMKIEKEEIKVKIDIYERVKAITERRLTLRMLIDIWFSCVLGAFSVVICAARAVYSFWPVAFEMVPPL